MCRLSGLGLRNITDEKYIDSGRAIIMTTLALKDGIIAYDTRVCAGNTISDDDFDKCIERKGVKFFIAGSTSDFEDFFDSFFANENTTNRILNIHAFVLQDDILWEASVSDDKLFWKTVMDTKKPAAGGTGSDHALTAMDMGATAKEAIKWAMKRDCKTGGKIRTYKL